MTSARAPMNERRLLFITLSNIGDLVLTTPALVAFHAAFPKHIIDIVADVRSSSLLRQCPFRGEIHHRDKRAGIPGLLRLITNLRRHYYDAIVDLRTDVLPWLLRGNRRAARWRRGVHGPHATEQHFAIATRVFDHVGAIPDTNVWLDDHDHQFATEAFAPFKQARCLALAPGANWPGKIWPASSFIALLQRCANDFDVVTVLGGANERGIGEFLSAQSPLPVLNFAGNTSITQAAAILDHANAFVGNDSGLGHIAAARGVKTLTLFGPGRPARYRPWGGRAAIIEAPSRDLSLLHANSVADALKQLLDDKNGNDS